MFSGVSINVIHLQSIIMPDTRHLYSLEFDFYLNRLLTYDPLQFFIFKQTFTAILTK